MFNTFKTLFGKTNPTFTITELPSGRFGVVSDGGTVFKTYTRKRDAERGAERAGLTLA